MKFLVDNSISPVVAKGLSDAGHDAVHVLNVAAHNTPDDQILKMAREADQTVIAYDLDFPKIVALRQYAKPSLIIFRDIRDERLQVQLILDNLEALTDGLTEGCVATFEPGRLRLRSLPIGKGL